MIGYDNNDGYLLYLVHHLINTTMTTKEDLMKVGWVYLNHFENFSMFGRLKVRIIYNETSKTVVGYYTENCIYFWNVTSKILEKFLKDLPDEKLAELKENEEE